MANQKEQCWRQHLTEDDNAFGYIGHCTHRKKEIDESGKVNLLRNILKIFSLGLIRGKFVCTLPEGEEKPTLCRKGRDYLAH